MASPQDVDRTSIERFKPYIQDIVKEFLHDSRVLWWEVFNEPRRDDEFSIALRKAAFTWIKELKPFAPILSCWDENEATELVDHHQYHVPWNGKYNLLEGTFVSILKFV